MMGIFKSLMNGSWNSQPQEKFHYVNKLPLYIILHDQKFYDRTQKNMFFYLKVGGSSAMNYDDNIIHTTFYLIEKFQKIIKFKTVHNYYRFLLK